MSKKIIIEITPSEKGWEDYKYGYLISEDKIFKSGGVVKDFEELSKHIEGYCKQLRREDMCEKCGQLLLSPSSPSVQSP